MESQSKRIVQNSIDEREIIWTSSYPFHIELVKSFGFGKKRTWLFKVHGSTIIQINRIVFVTLRIKFLNAERDK